MRISKIRSSLNVNLYQTAFIQNQVKFSREYPFKILFFAPSLLVMYVFELGIQCKETL